jgi:hypothetical protein
MHTITKITNEQYKNIIHAPRMIPIQLPRGDTSTTWDEELNIEYHQEATKFPQKFRQKIAKIYPVAGNRRYQTIGSPTIQSNEDIKTSVKNHNDEPLDFHP